jgi:large subunit ribosomal protein L25
VIYGEKTTPVCIQMDPRVLRAQMVKSGFFTQLFTIDLGASGREQVVARDVQIHKLTDQPIHVDFLRVSADHAIHVRVPVHFANEAGCPGLKKGGMLNVELHEIEVLSRPDAIPHEVVIDLTGLEIGHSIHIKDIALPDGVTLYHQSTEQTVASISAPTVAVESTETPAAG